MTEKTKTALFTNAQRHEVPDDMYLHIKHLHPANSSRSQRKGAPYMTIAKLVDKESKETMHFAIARCSRRDFPKRSTGYQVARGRVLAEWYRFIEDENNSEAETEAVGSLG